MNYVTEEGMKKLVKELHDLKFVERIEATERLNAARKHGDLRENGDYKAAREDIARIDGKITSLEDYISNSEIINAEDMTNDIVQILHKVKVKNLTRGMTLQYHIVSQAEADPVERKISAESPIGKGLLGSKVGDVVTVNVPAGELQFEILEISL